MATEAGSALQSRSLQSAEQPVREANSLHLVILVKVLLSLLLRGGRGRVILKNILQPCRAQDQALFSDHTVCCCCCC